VVESPPGYTLSDKMGRRLRTRKELNQGGSRPPVQDNIKGGEGGLGVAQWLQKSHRSHRRSLGGKEDSRKFVIEEEKKVSLTWVQVASDRSWGKEKSNLKRKRLIDRGKGRERNASSFYKGRPTLVVKRTGEKGRLRAWRPRSKEGSP